MSVLREEAERVRKQEERRELFEYQQKQDLIKEQELQVITTIQFIHLHVAYLLEWTWN